jgi:hypothetical protein
VQDQPDALAAMRRILLGGERAQAGMTAPAAGLYLWRVDYPAAYGIPTPTGGFW